MQHCLSSEFWRVGAGRTQGGQGLTRCYSAQKTDPRTRARLAATPYHSASRVECLWVEHKLRSALTEGVLELQRLRQQARPPRAKGACTHMQGVDTLAGSR